MIPAFLPENMLYNSVKEVCRGIGVSETKGFDSKTAAHPTAILRLDKESSREKWDVYNVDLGNGWTPKSIDEVQLVLCFGEATTTTGLCSVSQTTNRSEFQVIEAPARKSQLIDSRTGQVLWTGTLAEESRSCGGIYSIASAKEIRAFLEETIPYIGQ
jgi:hypothetical protein